MSQIKSEKKVVRGLKEQLSQRFNLVDFRLFGSKVWGGDTHEFDILNFCIF